MKFYRGSAGEAVGYAFSDDRLPAESRAEDYYLAPDADTVERLSDLLLGVAEPAGVLDHGCDAPPPRGG